MFLAERLEGGPRVAVRVLESGERGDGSALLESLREHVARVMALSARCPAIASLHECGRAEHGGIYIALERPEGPTLAEVLQGEARLDPARAVRIAARVAEVLESAHMLGIPHGGLVPRNIVLLGEDESVKLTEFGVSWLRARTCRDVESVAHSPYLAPEQLASGEATPQGDVYAVGAVLYEMLAGRPPEIQAPSRRRPSIQPLRKLRPDVSRSLEHVVTRALEPDPERRYRDMTDLFNDLWGQISPFSGRSPAQQDVRRRGLASGKRTRLIAGGIVFGAIAVVALLSRLLVAGPPALMSPEPQSAPLRQVAAPALTPLAPPAPPAPGPTPVVSEPEPQPVAPPPPMAPPRPEAVPPPPRPVAERPARPTPPPARAVVETSRPPAPPAPPAGQQEKSIRPAPRPAETPSPAAPTTVPAAAPVTAPAAARDAGEDGGAIIDWLLKESSSARR